MVKVYGVVPGEVWEYVPIRCREDPPDEQPVFELAVLSLQERTELMDTAGTVALEDRENPQTGLLEKTEVFTPATGKSVLKTLRKGLRGWRNFYGPPAEEGGDPIELECKLQGHQSSKDRKVKDESLGCLPDWLAIELSNAIQRGNTLSEAAKGN